MQGKEAWTSFNVGAKLLLITCMISGSSLNLFGPRWSLRPFPSLIFNPIFDEKSYYCKTRQIFSVGLK